MQGARCKVQGARCKVQGTRYKVQSTRYKVQGTKYKVQGTNYKVQGTSVFFLINNLYTKYFSLLYRHIQSRGYMVCIINNFRYKS